MRVERKWSKNTTGSDVFKRGRFLTFFIVTMVLRGNKIILISI